MTNRKRRRAKRRFLLWSILAVCAIVAVMLWRLPHARAERRVQMLEDTTIPSWIMPDLLDIGGGVTDRRLTDFGGIVIHYVGNPDTTAKANRNYFNQPATEVSAHFVVGLNGEIIQCLPLHKQSVASNQRNHDTISIEVCHPDDSGRFNDKTYASLVKLTAWLCDLGGLDTDTVIRHYDVTGKECPRHYVLHPEAWQSFLSAVQNARK